MNRRFCASPLHHAAELPSDDVAAGCLGRLPTEGPGVSSFSGRPAKKISDRREAANLLNWYDHDITPRLAPKFADNAADFCGFLKCLYIDIVVIIFLYLIYKFNCVRTILRISHCVLFAYLHPRFAYFHKSGLHWIPMWFIEYFSQPSDAERISYLYSLQVSSKSFVLFLRLAFATGFRIAAAMGRVRGEHMLCPYIVFSQLIRQMIWSLAKTGKKTYFARLNSWLAMYQNSHIIVSCQPCC